MPYVGAKDPEGIDIEIVSKVGAFDLSSITDVESLDGDAGKLTVQPPGNGTARSWAWSISGTPTATSIHLLHTFAADGSDVSSPGKWTVRGFAIAPGVRRRIKPISITFERY